MRVSTDVGILEPDPVTCELVLRHLHPGVTLEQAVDNTGWKLKVAPSIKVTAAPTSEDLIKVRKLVASSANS